jgi:hypothetical protein
MNAIMGHLKDDASFVMDLVCLMPIIVKNVLYRKGMYVYSTIYDYMIEGWMSKNYKSGNCKNRSIL